MILSTYLKHAFRVRYAFDINKYVRNIFINTKRVLKLNVLNDIKMCII